MNEVPGLKGGKMAEVEVAKKGGDDPEVKELLDNFNADIALVGDQIAPDGAKSYRTFTASLLAALNKKNATASDSMALSRTAEAARDKAVTDEKARADTAVAASDKVANEYKQESEKFAADREKMGQEKEVLTTQH